MSEVNVQSFGQVAVVTGKLIEKARYEDKDLSGTYRFTDVWTTRNQTWQLVAGQETLVRRQSETANDPNGAAVHGGLSVIA